MVMGVGLATMGLLLMAVSFSLWWLSIGFLLLSVANNMIVAPYSALVPDVTPADQRGVAAGWLGGMSMLGYLLGGIVSYHLETTGLFVAYFVLALVHALSMGVTVYFIPEEAVREPKSPDTLGGRCRSFIRPMMSHDFRVVFFTRFLMQMGIFTVQEYLQYYLEDAIRPVGFTLGDVVITTSPQRATSLLFLPIILGALVSSLISGIISDKIGGKRKVIVYVSGALMSITCIFFSITRSYALDMLLGLVFGVGFGAFSTMDWAMATDVLPNADEFAKDMGIWSLAIVLPQVIATPVAGHLLDYFQKSGDNLGYSVIFIVAVVYYGVGTWFVRYIDAVQ